MEPSLLGIPLEIRAPILSNLLVSSGNIHLRFPGGNTVPAESIYPNLIWTCKQLCEEGRRILYRENTFEIGVGPDFKNLAHGLPRYHTSNFDERVLRWIKRYDLHIQDPECYSFNIRNAIRKLCQTLSQSKPEHLSLRCYTTTYQSLEPFGYLRDVQIECLDVLPRYTQYLTDQIQRKPRGRLEETVRNLYRLMEDLDVDDEKHP